MELKKNQEQSSEFALAESICQSEPTTYYTQDPQKGAQQIYTAGTTMELNQSPVQNVQSPAQYAPIAQNLSSESKFNPNCPRCYGSGFNYRGNPCKGCCVAAGFCYRCGGYGKTRRGYPCRNCAFHSNAGKCPACTLKKALGGRKNRPCLICRTIQRLKF